MINKEKLIKNFMELVRIDSLSLNERKMADKLIVELEKLGCEVYEDNSGQVIGGNTGNIIADLPGQKDYPVLLFSAHMDRVEPGEGIEPFVSGKLIKSKGKKILAADDLAGVVTILESIKIIKEQNIEHGSLKIIFTVGEELGLQGSKNLNADILSQVDYGFVLDSSGTVGQVIYKGPAKNKFNAIIRGKSAHAGINPDQGINAIKIASKAISTMNLGQIDQETTANIGVIRGGFSRNVVPDLVELEGEVRSHNQDKLYKQIDHMKQVIKNSVLEYKGQVEFNIESLYTNFSLKQDSNIINLIKEASSNLEIIIDFVASCGGSDANIFNQKGLPTLNLAVGVENVHSAEEQIETKQLYKLINFVINIIKISKEYKNV